MKKIIKLSIFTLLICISMICINSSKASAQIYEDYQYEIQDDNTVKIKKYIGTSTIANIPSEIDGHSVTMVGYDAFKGCTSLKEITIPSNVKDIFDNAYEDIFEGCTNLKEIRVDSNNKNYSSEQGILYNKTKTKLIRCPIAIEKSTITIPNSVTSIKDNAFNDCKCLEDITISSSVTEMFNNTYADVFEGCTSLKEIRVDSNNKNYSSEQGVLYNKAKTELIRCPLVKSTITIPNSVTSIKNTAFSDCKVLKEITIPSSVTEIGGGIFEGIKSLRGDIFNGCTNLREIKVDSNNKNYSSEQGVLYNKTKTYLVRCPLTKSTITIPNSVKVIDTYAFSSCIGLTEITIPSSVKDIFDNAFDGCINLTEITIPNSVELICASAFWGCASLKEITIPNSVTQIGSDAFSGCTSLTEITIPNSVVDIGVNVFSSIFDGCTSLNEIIIDVNNKNYSSEQGVVYNKTKTKLIRCPIAIKKSTITIPNSVIEIDRFAFKDCTSLTEIMIPSSVTYIGQDAFSGSPNLVIYLEENSYAHKYAKENNIKYKFVQTVIGQTKGIVTKAQSTKSITVAWKKDTTVSGYEIYMSTNKSKGYKKIKTITKNSITSYNKTNLKEGTIYYFKVRAYKTVGKSNKYGAYSSILTTTTRTKAPKISKVTAGKKKATVKWGKVTGATGYEIYMSTKKSSGYKKVGTNTKNSKVSYTKTKLTKKKKYYFKVRTYKIVNGKKVYSSFSNIKSVKVK